MSRLLIVLSLFLVCSVLHAQSQQASTTLQGRRESSMEVGPAFTRNDGQLADQYGKPMSDVLYYADFRDLRLYVTGRGLHFVLGKIVQQSASHAIDERLKGGTFVREADSILLYRVDMLFNGGQLPSGITTSAPRGDVMNFYHAHCPDGVLGVPSFRKLRLQNIYPGIDFEIYTRGSHFKYDFIVQPGADPSNIRLKYEGDVSLKSTGQGLTVMTPFGELHESKPVTFQPNGRGDRTIRSGFVIKGKSVSFSVGSYDRSQTLIIDPARSWATFYGGQFAEYIYDVHAETAPDIYFCGSTRSGNYISTAGTHQVAYSAQQDAFLVKFNENGVRQWATYYGGAGTDVANAVVTHSEGGTRYVYITGGTSSPTSIATAGAHQTSGYASDGFLAKFNDNGIRQWGTYYSGTGDDVANDAAITTDGYVVIGGRTYSANGIASVGAHQTSTGGNADGWLAKFSTAGVRQWGTFYGGSDQDYVLGLAAGAGGDILIGGPTWSTDAIATAGTHQSVHAGSYDGFIVKFNASGVRQWGTYYGGPSGDLLQALGSDGSGIQVCGSTNSNSGIATAGAHLTSAQGVTDVFVARFTNDGAREWGTYYGGSGDDHGVDINHDENTIVITGATSSASGIATPGEHQTSQSAVDDVEGYVAVFNVNGQLQWGSYYGAVGQDWFYEADYGNNGVYIAGVAGSATSSLVTAGAHQTFDGGAGDGLLVKFCNIPRPTIAASAGAILCAGETTTLSVPNNYLTYQWRNGSTDISGATQNSFALPTTLAPGTHKFTVNVTNATCAIRTDSFTVTINPRPIVDAGSDVTICVRDTVVLGNVATSGTSPYTYVWTTNVGLSDASIAQPRAYPTATTQYIVRVTDAKGCMDEDTVVVTVNPLPTITPAPDVAICSGESATIGTSASGGTAPYSYQWSPSGGLNSTTAATPTASPIASTTYRVEITDSKGCKVHDTVAVTVNPMPSLDLGPDIAICENNSTTLSGFPTGGTTPYTYNWSPAQGLTSTTIANPGVAAASTTKYYLQVTDAKGCSVRDSILVLVNPQPKPVITADGPLTICEGDQRRLRAPAGFTFYQWSSNETTEQITVSKAGSYSVNVIDVNGCTGVSPAVTIAVNPRPTATLNGPRSVCQNASSTYQVTSDPSVTYAWTLASGGQILGATDQSQAQVRWTTIGSWQLQVRITNPATGCVRDTMFAVDVSSSLTPKLSTTGAITLCQNDTLVLRAEKGYSSYRWSTGSTADSLIVTGAGAYNVTVSDAGGCSGTSANVVVSLSPETKPRPVIAATRTTICDGDSVQLSADQGYASYLWSTGETSASIWVKSAGTYDLSVRNIAGCEGRSSALALSVLPNLPLSITASGPLTMCEGSSVRLTASGGFAEYRWSSGESSSSIVVTQGGVYTVTGFNSNGCQRSSSVTVVVNPSPMPVIQGPVAACINGQSTYAVAPVTGSTATWAVTGGTILTGQGTDKITVQWGAGAAGSVNVDQVITASACKGTAARVDVALGSSLRPTILADGDLVLCGTELLTLDAGDGYMTYQWSTGAATRTIVVNQPGTYSVFVDDGQGCSGRSDDLIVTQGQVPNVAITNAGAIRFCEGDSVVLTASPGLSAYQWRFNGTPVAGATLERYVARAAGSYDVLGTNATGCSDQSAAISVTVDPRPLKPVIVQAGTDLTTGVYAGYQWYLNGNPIVGATNQLLTPGAAGNYQVEVTNAEGCSNRSEVFPFTSRMVSLSLPELLYVASGETVVLPLAIVNAAGEAFLFDAAYEYAVSFDNSLLLPVSPVDASIINGTRRTVTIRGDRGMAGGTLSELELLATLGTDSCTDVRIERFDASDGSRLGSVRHGRICLSDLCREGGARYFDASARVGIGQNRPNPASHQTSIDYSIAESGPTVLEVHDALGRVVRRYIAEQEPGSYTMTIDLKDLAQGTYYYILRTPTQALSRQLMIAR